MARSFPDIDFEEFHRVELPAQIASGNGALAAADVAGVQPIAFKVPDGGAFSYVPGADGVEIWATDVAADTVVELSREAFSDFANELHTCFGLLYAGLAETSRGDFASFERWEPALRALYHGRPIVDPATMDLPDDLGRSFSLDDPDDDVRDFLHRAGFAHLRGVFDASEIAAFADEVEAARAAARKDDGHSWWATRADGEEVCCRVTYLERSSPTIADVAGDARLTRIAALGAEGLVPETGCLDGQSVVIKHPEITAGLSDLPWHRDCGLGGHPVLCPSVAIGIQLDPATEATGQLCFLAGSHLGSSHPLRPRDEEHQPTVAVDTEPGDVTVHFGHVLHAAPPPTGGSDGRRALYATYCRPETIEFVGEGKGYNDVLFERDGQVHNVDELLADA
ncbi:MAG TPA: phytanoyl-CoA dioxygenase family protein [Acidimicrobiia bacterium]|nr:phytanoyl-CoA dioxygenase family protein [Acidimicrobiia bacterium]